MRTIVTAIFTIAAALALAACGGGETTGGVAMAGGSTATEVGPATEPPAQHSDEDGAAKGDGQGASSRKAQDGGGFEGGSSGTAPGDTSSSFTPPVHHDAAIGPAPFEAKGGDNSIQEFGAEGSNPEFQAAATALHGYLDARAAGAWRAACSYMSSGTAKSLAQLGASGGGASCPEALASLSAAVPAAALREAAEAEVGALRTEGDRGFLLFHGAHGVAYFIPMAAEGGTWKVAAIAPSAIP